MATLYFFTQADLEDAIGVQTVAAIFDDDSSGQPNARALTSCQAYGTSQARTWLYGSYPVPLVSADVTDDIKFAAVDFGIAYAFRRRPDLVKAMNLESWTTFQKAATDRMERFLNGLQDLAPKPDDGTVTTSEGLGVSSDCPRYERRRF